MVMRIRYPGYAVLLAAVVACSTGTIHAPVDSRNPLAHSPRVTAVARSGYYIGRAKIIGIHRLFLPMIRELNMDL